MSSSSRLNEIILYVVGPPGQHFSSSGTLCKRIVLHLEEVTWNGSVTKMSHIKKILTSTFIYFYMLHCYSLSLHGWKKGGSKICRGKILVGG